MPKACTAPRSCGGAGGCQRIAGPDHQAEIGDDEGQAEREQHLRQVPGRQAAAAGSARCAPPMTAMATRRSPARRARNSCPDGEERHAEIGPQHEERAVHQVGNAHQPEDEREAGGQQEQQPAEGDAVHRQSEPEGHRRRPRAPTGASIGLSSVRRFFTRTDRSNTERRSAARRDAAGGVFDAAPVRKETVARAIGGSRAIRLMAIPDIFAGG